MRDENRQQPSPTPPAKLPMLPHPSPTGQQATATNPRQLCVILSAAERFAKRSFPEPKSLPRSEAEGTLRSPTVPKCRKEAPAFAEHHQNRGACGLSRRCTLGKSAADG